LHRRQPPKADEEHGMEDGEHRDDAWPRLESATIR